MKKYIFDIDGKIPGFQYIGEIYIPTSGDYEVRFNVIGGYDIEVMIRVIVFHRVVIPNQDFF